MNRAPKTENFNNVKQYSSGSVPTHHSRTFMLLSLEASPSISEHPWEVPHGFWRPLPLEFCMWWWPFLALSLALGPRKCPAGALGLGLPDAYQSRASWHPTAVMPLGYWVLSCCATLVMHWHLRVAAPCCALHRRGETFTCGFGLDPFREPWGCVVCCALRSWNLVFS